MIYSKDRHGKLKNLDLDKVKNPLGSKCELFISNSKTEK